MGAGGTRKAVEGKEGIEETTGGERKKEEGIGFGEPIIGEKEVLVASLGLPNVERGRPEVAERVMGRGEEGAKVGDARPRGEWGGTGETERLNAEGILEGEGGLRWSLIDELYSKDLTRSMTEGRRTIPFEGAAVVASALTTVVVEVNDATGTTGTGFAVEIAA